MPRNPTRHYFESEGTERCPYCGQYVATDVFSLSEVVSLISHTHPESTGGSLPCPASRAWRAQRSA